MMRILIADDHEVVRRGLKQILLENLPFVYVEEAGDTDTLITKAIHSSWDIIISDIAMPGAGGIAALKIIKERIPSQLFLFFSAHPEDQYAEKLLKAGADGYFNKDITPEELSKAIQQLLAGKKNISGHFPATVDAPIPALKERAPHELLSERELNIFTMIASGKSITDLAAILSLAPTTISTYRLRILVKMNMKTNAELTRYAIEHSFI